MARKLKRKSTVSHRDPSAAPDPEHLKRFRALMSGLAVVPKAEIERLEQEKRHIEEAIAEVERVLQERKKKS